MTANDIRRPGVQTPGTYDILQVEDNPGDARFTREAFEATTQEVDLEVVDTGSAALDHLTDDVTSPPSLVLLDLDLEDVNGFDVLRELRDDPELSRIPVLVFSDSSDMDDVAASYEMGANAFVSKPRDATGYFRTIDRIATFWLRTRTLTPTATDE